MDGSNNGIKECEPFLVGIFYKNASGAVNEIALRNQKLTPNLNACQSGNALFVQSGNGGTSTVSVTRSIAHDYQKNAFTGNNQGTTLVVEESSARGQGPTTGAAENGIQMGFGATGKIVRNRVIDYIYAPCISTSSCAAAAAGILVFNAPSVETRGNVEGNSQSGIIYITEIGGGFPGPPSDNATVVGNRVFGTSIFDGIDMCSNKNKIIKNVVADSDEAAIHLDWTCSGTGNNNLVVGNVINVINEACAGVLNGGGGNKIQDNRFANVKNEVLPGDTCSDPPGAAGHAPGHGPVRPTR